MKNMIRSYFEGRGDVSLSEYGESIVTCPFHKQGKERNPSMSINLRKGKFHCFTCKRGGNLTMLSTLLGFNETDVSPKDLKNYALSCYQTLWKTPEVIKVAQRGFLTTNLIKQFMWGYDDNINAITIPTFDLDMLAGVKLRYLDSIKKYGWYKKAYSSIYFPKRYSDLLRNSTLNIVSGIWDVAAMVSVGEFAICSGISELCYNSAMISQISRMISAFNVLGITIWVDNDATGRQSSLLLSSKLLCDDIDINVPINIKGLTKFPSGLKDICDLVAEGKGRLGRLSEFSSTTVKE